uniref:Uncharacterized protein n=1 Tax=Solanum lycopersicum TaxID=4081 RepID=A0A3Q7F6W3_SOLLC
MFHFLVFLLGLIGKLVLAAKLGFEVFELIMFGRRKVQFILLQLYPKSTETSTWQYYLGILNLFSAYVEEGIAKSTGAQGSRSILEIILTEATFEAADLNVKATQDLSEKDVQQALLKMLEGTIVSVPDNRAWKIPPGDTIQAVTNTTYIWQFLIF